MEIGDGCEKRFSPEDFYLYVTTHAYKHYHGGGCGLRTLLDTYMMLKKLNPDPAYAAAEAEKMGIADFEKENRGLALRLFGGEELTAEDRERLDYMFSSGAGGTVLHRVENGLRKTGKSKIRYALDRFIAPQNKKGRDYASYKRMYPFFYQHKLLLAFLPFYRMFRAFKRGALAAEVKAIKNANRQPDKTA